MIFYQDPTWFYIAMVPVFFVLAVGVLLISIGTYKEMTKNPRRTNERDS